MSEYWDDRFETMDLERLQSFQLEKLQETLRWVYERVPFYKKAFDDKGVKPEDCRNLADLRHYPFTVKNDLRDNYPFGLCAVPLSDVVRIHASSGTTGKPITGPYTSQDLEAWSACMARTLWAQGVRPEDICQNAYGYGLFTGGLGFHQGAGAIGCAVVPTSSGLTERQIMLMQDFGSTVLFATPTYALTIAERAEKMGVAFRQLPLRIGCFGAEPWTSAMRKEIEDRMGIKAHEAYGLTEMMGPGVAFSCPEYHLHINEDHIFPEIIDPITEEPVEPGQQGELVFTAIQRRAMPLIRYRTKDITTLRRDKCACGRTLITMDKVTGRFDDMLIISGVNVFPSQIEAMIMDFPEMEPHYLIRVFKKGYLDNLTVEAEAKEDVYGRGQGALDELRQKISAHIHQTIGINVPVTIAPFNSIARSEGKAKRVIDER
ncbi:MAG: phenylacetate--CoA ligase [Proteobacteria bacterium]|nr:phenylacetate--CoA ligase [Pseudomonadota bacterium]